jgi:hypothetical protein
LTELVGNGFNTIGIGNLFVKEMSMKTIYITGILSLVSVMLFCGCGDNPQVDVSVAPVRHTEATYAVSRLTANLLNRKPVDDMDKPGILLMINQGDQVVPIQESDNWTQVQHVLTGTIGWLHKSFVQVEERSKWWSGDTDRARVSAERIYQNKQFLIRDWPVAHINVEERWNKAVLSGLENQDFPRDKAIRCAEFVLAELKERFPGWRDRQVFINAKASDQPYTLVMSDDKTPTFL